MARYFTKQQIAEIKQRLATESVRDTDFDETTPLTGDEFIAVIQDGLNRKVTMADFVEEVTDNFVVIPEGDIALYNKTGDSTKHGMTQLAITRELANKVNIIDILNYLSRLSEAEVQALLNL